MRPRTFPIAAAVTVVLSAAAVPAMAQASRTFVSGHGDDANPCSLSAPCRTFAQAAMQTNAGGEITVLDPAGYGPVTITTGLSIINDGVGEAGITTSAPVSAITITAGPSDVINLRGLTLIGSNTFNAGDNGISFTTGGTLNIQNCVMRNFGDYGIKAAPSSSSKFNISDTLVVGNLLGGINIQPSGRGTNTAYFKRVQAIGNLSAGLILNGNFATGGTLTGTASDSLSSNNIYGLVVGSSNSAAVTTFMVVNSQVVNNSSVGLLSQEPNSAIIIAQSRVSGNGFYGYAAQFGGVIQTFGNNQIADTTNMGTLSPLNAK